MPPAAGGVRAFVCVVHPPRRPIIYDAISNKRRKKATTGGERERGELIFHGR